MTRKRRQVAQPQRTALEVGPAALAVVGTALVAIAGGLPVVALALLAVAVLALVASAVLAVRLGARLGTTPLFATTVVSIALSLSSLAVTVILGPSTVAYTASIVVLGGIAHVALQAAAARRAAR